MILNFVWHIWNRRVLDIFYFKFRKAGNPNNNFYPYLGIKTKTKLCHFLFYPLNSGCSLKTSTLEYGHGSKLFLSFIMYAEDIFPWIKLFVYGHTAMLSRYFKVVIFKIRENLEIWVINSMHLTNLENIWPVIMVTIEFNYYTQPVNQYGFLFF